MSLLIALSASSLSSSARFRTRVAPPGCRAAHPRAPSRTTDPVSASTTPKRRHAFCSSIWLLMRASGAPAWPLGLAKCTIAPICGSDRSNVHYHKRISAGIHGHAGTRGRGLGRNSAAEICLPRLVFLQAGLAHDLHVRALGRRAADLPPELLREAAGAHHAEPARDRGEEPVFTSDRKGALGK